MDTLVQGKHCTKCGAKIELEPFRVRGEVSSKLIDWCSGCLIAYREERAERLAQKTERAGKRRKVYFIQSDNGPIKIGIAFHVGTRLKELQTSHPHALQCLAWCPGGRKAEKMLHWRFRRFHLRGEWFTPCDDLLRIIKALKEIRSTRPLEEQDLFKLARMKPRDWRIHEKQRRPWTT